MFVYVCVPLQGSCLDAVLGSAAPPYNGQLQNTNTYEFVVVVLNGLISSQQAPCPTPPQDPGDMWAHCCKHSSLFGVKGLLRMGGGDSATSLSLK